MLDFGGEFDRGELVQGEIDITQWADGQVFLESLIEAMVQADRSKRPTIYQDVSYFEELIARRIRVAFDCRFGTA